MSDHLREWLAKASAEERTRVAEEAGTSVGHLWQLAGGHRKASDKLAERLQDASSGEITIAGLRPDLVLLAEKILQGGRKAMLMDRYLASSPDLDEIVPPASQSDQTNKPAGDPSSVGGAA